MGSNTDITAGNFTKKMFEGMGMTPHGEDTQVSEFFKYQTDDGGKTTVRLSDQSGKVLTIIKRKKVGQIKALKQGGFFNRKCKH